MREKLLEQYRKAFLEFFINLGKVSGKSIDLDKVLSKMSYHGFATLAHRFTGRNCSDIEFNSSVAKMFEHLMNEFSQGSLQ